MKDITKEKRPADHCGSCWKKHPTTKSGGGWWGWDKDKYCWTVLGEHLGTISNCYNLYKFTTPCGKNGTTSVDSSD